MVRNVLKSVFLQFVALAAVFALASIIVVLLAAAVSTMNPKAKVTRRASDRVQVGMSKQEVERTLGESRGSMHFNSEGPEANKLKQCGAVDSGVWLGTRIIITVGYGRDGRVVYKEVHDLDLQKR